MRFCARQLTVVLGFLLALTTFAFTQSATTSIHGTVTDSKGAVVVGATVTLSDPATGVSRDTKTTDQGVYQFLEIPPATYQLTVTAQGFAVIKETNIQLLVRTPATLNVTMQVAGGTEVVEVNAAAALINTEDASMGHAFDKSQIESLPFEGREPTSILTLQAGVVYTGNSRAINSQTQSGYDSDSRSGTVNGGRSDQTNITLDGTDNNDQAGGRALQGAIRVPLDSLEEFRVTTANADADTGRSSGGQVALVTKTGTNSFHGGAYEYYRPTFTANDWFNEQAQVGNGLPNRPPFFLRNTFGAFVGGPIKKDRAFFFLSYEGMRKREDQIVTQTVPSGSPTTNGLRNGYISYCTDPACTPSLVHTLTPANLASIDPNCGAIGSCVFTGQPAPAAGLCQGTFPTCPGPNPYVMQVFQKYPVANSTAVGDGYNLLGYTFASPWPDNLNMFVGKIDYNLTANGSHRLFVRGVQDGDHNSAGAEQFPGQPNSVIEVVTSKGVTAGYTATFANSWINNFRYGYIREAFDDRGLQNSHFVHFRFMSDFNAFSPSVNRHVPVQNFVDDVSKIKGNHTLQFGVNIRKVDNVSNSNQTSFFTATTNQDWMSPTTIAGAGVSLDPSTGAFPAVDGGFIQSYDVAVTDLAGLVSEVSANYNLDKHLNALPEGAMIHRDYRDWEYEWYAQDAWRVRPNLTVTFGLRYSLLEPPYETSGTQVAPTTSTHDWFIQRSQAAYNGQNYFVTGMDPLGNPVFDPSHELQFALSGQANHAKPYWGWDYKNFAPRLALAYSPSADSGFARKIWGAPGKSSIRLGWGMYFDHFGQGITSSFDRENGFGLSSSNGNAAGSVAVDCASRFTSLTTIPATYYGQPGGACSSPPTVPYYSAAPSGSFPIVPSANPGYITFGLDDKLKTPYSHVFDLSITRDLGNGFVFEASYVGRFGHRLLQEIDLAQPANLRDPVSGMTYYQAAQALAKQYRAGVPIQNVAKIPYWENVFPMASSAKGGVLFGPYEGFPTCVNGEGALTNFTATQSMYDLFGCFGMSPNGAGGYSVVGNETSALAAADLAGYWGYSGPGGPCIPACATINGKQSPYAFYSPQTASMDAWGSIGNSAYNSGQFSLRRHTGALAFDINYTYSKSIDVGSNAERISVFEGLGFSSQVINAWMPKQLRAPSDFDTTHMINSNWVYQLPVGKGKHFGANMSKLADAIVGGWQISGLWRWSTGYPFDVYAFNNWATNWDLESYGVLTGAKPKTGQFKVNGNTPNVFQDPSAALNSFRYSLPGESGQRNELRGPGSFDIDMGLAKAWKITESQNLKLSWEVFNVTNTPRFDVGSMMNNNNFLDSAASFGNFINTLSQQRVMQLGARYTF
ncbi:MAG TPA: carboxypeptidase-like regulatory domain-containing protein [Candidatus Sulfotelmatobacter sp.]|nr:carboxypeptidase-like regulatory domain-containing protein [Candidatus Sulfotelmatobacter sp.]